MGLAQVILVMALCVTLIHSYPSISQNEQSGISGSLQKALSIKEIRDKRSPDRDGDSSEENGGWWWGKRSADDSSEESDEEGRKKRSADRDGDSSEENGGWWWGKRSADDSS